MVVPPVMPWPLMAKGGQSVPLVAVISTPQPRKAFINGPMGRWCMRGSPSIINEEWPREATEVRNLVAVPLLPRKIACLEGWIKPPLPCICQTLPLSIDIPICIRAAEEYSVSSLSSGPSSVLVPSASDAAIRALWVRLFEPGTSMEASIFDTGSISIIVLSQFFY